MSIPELQEKLISVDSLLNPLFITSLKFWDQQSISLSPPLPTITAEIVRSADSQTRTNWKHTTLNVTETVKTAPSLENHRKSHVDVFLESHTKSCKRKNQKVRKNKRGRIPLHPEMSPEERALWRVYSNREAAAKSRQKQKEHILHLEHLLKNSQISILLLNRTCAVYGFIIQQLQQQIMNCSVNSKN